MRAGSSSALTPEILHPTQALVLQLLPALMLSDPSLFSHLAHGQVPLQRQLRQHNVVLHIPCVQLGGGQRHRALHRGV